MYWHVIFAFHRSFATSLVADATRLSLSLDHVKVTKGIENTAGGARMVGSTATHIWVL